MVCVIEESGPAVLDQPIPSLLCVMEESGPAVLDQPTPSLLCVMEESGPAVLDQPTLPPLCDGGEWSSCARPTHAPLSSSV